MSGRLDPWTELRLTARNALHADHLAIVAAGMIADRCRFLTREQGVGAYGVALNALKSTVQAWAAMPEALSRDYAPAIAHQLRVLDEWPEHEAVPKIPPQIPPYARRA